MPTSADTRRPAPDGGGRASRRELWCVAALCAVAGARVFFGAAALPFFADTDENAHFDLVHKFARGSWPGKGVQLHDPETVELWIVDGSPEFLNRPGTLGVEQGFPPPVRDWQRGPVTATYLRQQWAVRGRLPNHEAHEPPLYYALAAAWYECGRAFGLSGARSVYWVRFLNAPLYAALVACAYAFCRPYFGRDTALAAAALTAFFPNTVFFTVNNDVLSPLAGGLALLLLLRWYEREKPGPGLSAAAGAAAAAAVLVKLTNAALLAAVAAAVLLRGRREGRPVRALLGSWPLLASAALPPLLWGLRNRLVLGDWAGTAVKVAVQHWTPKSFGQLPDHPLFSAGGAAAFLKTLGVSFFAGDANWGGGAARFPPAEVFFLATAVLLPAAGLAAALRRGGREPPARLAAGMSALVVVAFVAELAVLSLQYDFGDCPFPSRRFPFFAFGRLAGGALVPFLALYASGTEALAGRRPALAAAAVAAAVAMMLLTQLAYLSPAVSSQYNWFHLP